jgi:adenylylsulfate kinase
MTTVTKVFWLFGRSGAGKTTVALRLCEGLLTRGVPVIHLDGDEMRATLCSDLGFRPEARLENHRRIAEVARLLAGQDLNVVVATMAPEYLQRDLVAQILGDKLVWIFIDAPLSVCMARDPKGIYKRAQAGQLAQLIDYPFEDPRPDELRNRVSTVMQTVEESSHAILQIAKSHLNDFII